MIGWPARESSGRAFTLVELLVTVAILSVLVGLLLPALADVRGAADSSACALRQRQVVIACLSYADENDGQSPALGVPWGRRPFWALEAASRLGVRGETTAELYAGASNILVCQGARRVAGIDLERTDAINVTGHAGASGSGSDPADPDDFDAGLAHIDLYRVASPSSVALLIDATWTDAASDGPPRTRFLSTIDYRNDEHVATRIGYWHPDDRSNWTAVDASVRALRLGDAVDPRWSLPLP
ncbi:MAG: prepilin-type N-terminal cleavage/methylation domain-containing protein [Planctomycetota bacterium]